MLRQFIRASLLLFFSLLLCSRTSMAQSSTYTSPDQVFQWIESIKAKNPGVVETLKIATSPGGRPVTVIEIGREAGKDIKTLPSIFVGANLEGTRPISTEGAIFLTDMLLADPSQYDSLNWYILPLGNPDAATGFFESPLSENSRNDLPFNDDKDDQIDEDGVNDLNGDGWITTMRVKHPDGKWVVSEEDPRLMRMADPKKGEQGIFKLYSEGIDEDLDGLYNEDGKGGTNVGINFPHQFKHFTSQGGIYPGSAPESFAIMKFVFEHPDIAMIFSFGATNYCYTPPKADRKGEADLNKIKISGRRARWYNLDPSRTYTIKELVDIISESNPQLNVDESMVAGMLGLGAAVNPLPGDLQFYQKYADEYKTFLQERGTEFKRFESSAAKDGAFELWSYFHVGVPVFSMDLWGIEKISPSDSVSIPEKKGKPQAAEYSEALLAHSDALTDKNGFVDWTPYDHPTLGPVEIGGFVPYTGTTPPVEWVDSLLQLQVPWILTLAREIPDLYIYNTQISSKGSGIYQLEVWVENRSFISFPTDMGSRNMQPAPAVLSIEGSQLEFISGYQRTPIRRVAGKSRAKSTFILHKEKPGKITLKLESKTAGNDQVTIKIGG
jgi:Zinc carboxypeptidase